MDFVEAGRDQRENRHGESAVARKGTKRGAVSPVTLWRPHTVTHTRLTKATQVTYVFVCRPAAAKAIDENGRVTMGRDRELLYQAAETW